MRIHKEFPCGNIQIERMTDTEVFLDRELRDTGEEWFYWSFCVEGAAGTTVTFHFPSKIRIGRFGPAISHDLKTWHWQDVPCDGDCFTYSFGANENRVYFAHSMLYPAERFSQFCAMHSLPEETFCISRKGRSVPCVRFGHGDRWILLTSRHHACETTGTYVLEGALETLLQHLPEEYSVLAVPFMDYDGVVDGDQGKARIPHDHNQDYIDSPIYPEPKTLMQFATSHNVVYVFDFHSPWHIGEQNDTVFFSRSTTAMEPNADRFAEIFRRLSAGSSMHYDRIHDVGPNELWNNENNLISKNYFSRLPSVHLSVTLETTYFGLEENSKVSQAGMLQLGTHFGQSILEYIRTDNT